MQKQHRVLFPFHLRSTALAKGIQSAFAIAMIVAVMAVPSYAQFEGSQTVPDAWKPGFDSINAETANEWLSLLAGPKFEGRGTGQPGYTKAAHWVAGKAAEFGLQPMGEGGTYFQMLPMTQLTVDSGNSKITGPDGLNISATNNLGFDRFADQPLVKGKVVFVTLTGETTGFQENELQGKIVIYATDKPDGRAQQLIARERPAVALRVVDAPPKSGSQLLREGGRRRSTSVSGSITKMAAMEIAEKLGGGVSWIELGSKSEVHQTEKEVSVEIRTREQNAGVPNVLAWLEGSDPELKHEYIVLGSHLDHLGVVGGKTFFGADDNGSGSTANLCIARAMAMNPVKPKRSVLFMWFAAEEIGLVGSAYYTDHPILPLEDMACMFNIDMVGRNEEKPDEPASQNENTIHLIGSKQGDVDLHEVIMEANKYVNFTFEYDEESVFGRSDQANFFRKGTSVAFLFGGFHPDYHEPTDQPSRINYNKIASAAKLYYMSIALAADHDPFKVPKKEAP